MYNIYAPQHKPKNKQCHGTYFKFHIFLVVAFFSHMGDIFSEGSIYIKKIIEGTSTTDSVVSYMVIS